MSEGNCVACGKPSTYCQTFRVCNQVCGNRIENLDRLRQENKTVEDDRRYVEDMRRSRDDMRSAWEHQVLVRVDLERKLAELKDRVNELERVELIPLILALMVALPSEVKYYEEYEELAKAINDITPKFYTCT